MATVLGDDPFLFTLPIRAVNLEWAFQICDRQGRRAALAEYFGLKPSFTTRLTTGETEITTVHLDAAAKVLWLNLLPNYSIGWWDFQFSAFDKVLRDADFGKYKGMQNVLAWLGTIERQACFFVSGDRAKGLRAAYRSFGRPVSRNTDHFDAEGVIGHRYGVVTLLPPGPVLTAVRRKNAVAFLVHRDRVDGGTDVLSLDATAVPGSIDEVLWHQTPLLDPEDEARGSTRQESTTLTACLLASADGGEIIAGHPGRRDVYVFLFTPDALTNALREALANGEHPFVSKFGNSLEYAFREAQKELKGPREIGTKAQAMHFVYDAREDAP